MIFSFFRLQKLKNAHILALSGQLKESRSARGPPSGGFPSAAAANQFIAPIRAFLVSSYAPITSFCPETAIFRNLIVNLRARLCGVYIYASAQPLDFLELAENISFPIQKLK